MRRFREPIYGQIAQLLDTYWRPGVDDQTKAELLRTIIDTVQTHVGQSLLRHLPRARAYHSRGGELNELELLTSGAVIRLIRETTGMGDEPAQPIERETRRGLGRRLQE